MAINPALLQNTLFARMMQQKALQNQMDLQERRYQEERAFQEQEVQRQNKLQDVNAMGQALDRLSKEDEKAFQRQMSIAQATGQLAGKEGEAGPNYKQAAFQAISDLSRKQAEWELNREEQARQRESEKLFVGSEPLVAGLGEYLKTGSIGKGVLAQESILPAEEPYVGFQERGRVEALKELAKQKAMLSELNLGRGRLGLERNRLQIGRGSPSYPKLKYYDALVREFKANDKVLNYTNRTAMQEELLKAREEAKLEAESSPGGSQAFSIIDESARPYIQSQPPSIWAPTPTEGPTMQTPAPSSGTSISPADIDARRKQRGK